MSSAPDLRYAVLADRALIRLDGEGWRPFLQGLITQDVEGQAEGEARYAALLTPQGRVLFDLFVLADAQGATLDVAAGTRETLLTRLRMYRLRAKVAIELMDGPVTAAFGSGGEAGAGFVRDPRLTKLGWRGAGVSPPPAAADGDYEHHRLTLGVGDVVRDDLADRAYAMEANLDLLNGVDFRKGCFVGQETTSRMKRRSGARSRLVGLRFEGAAPPPGSEVLNDELRAGEVCSGIDGMALALLRLDRIDGPLHVGDRPVRPAPADWLAPILADGEALPA